MLQLSVLKRLRACCSSRSRSGFALAAALSPGRLRACCISRSRSGFALAAALSPEAASRLLAPLSLLVATPLVSRAGLPRPLLDDSAWSSRARIPLEFGCSRPVPHSWLHSFDCPASQVKNNLDARELLRRLLSQFCVFDLHNLKAKAGYALQPSMTQKPQLQSYTIRVWSYETFIVPASSSSG